MSSSSSTCSSSIRNNTKHAGRADPSLPAQPLRAAASTLSQKGRLRVLRHQVRWGRSLGEIVTESRTRSNGKMPPLLMQQGWMVC
ncbi:MAG: hypothetical protein AB8B36_13195 [Prochlorococcus sp.]